MFVAKPYFRGLMETQSAEIKKFLTRAVFLFLLFIAINQIQFLFTSPYYGNELYRRKFEHFEASELTYNTVFFGSSRTFRQINPALFDSLLHDYEIKSFNCGAPAVSNPEQYYLYETFLKDPPPGIRYAFMELKPINYISRVNLWTPRNYYWHTPDWVVYVYRYLSQSMLPFKNKIGYSLDYSFSLFLKYTHLGFLNMSHEKPAKQEEILGYKGNGFLPLEDQIQLTPDDTAFEARREEFKRDTVILAQRIRQSVEDFGSTISNEWLNRVHLTKLEQLIAQSTAKGIHLIFIIPPMLPEYRETLALQQALPSQHVIELADYRKYPEFYSRENLFDHGHLNAAGAALFTTKLATDFSELIQK